MVLKISPLTPPARIIKGKNPYRLYSDEAVLLAVEIGSKKAISEAKRRGLTQ